MGAGTIHNKLQGTVYDLDFDEDLKCGDNMENLKSMRERRRSIEYRHQSDASYRSRDASESPKFTATAANSQKIGKSFISVAYTNRPQNHNFNFVLGLGEKPVSAWRAEVRDMRPPSVHDVNAAAAGAGVGAGATAAVIPIQNIPSAAQPSMHTIEPVMPGPVDMRTYNSGFDTSNTDVFNSSNMMGGFASGLPDQTLQDIDEEFEKDFQTALKASNSRAATSASRNEVAHSNQLELDALRKNVHEMQFTSHVVDPTMMDPTMSAYDQLEGDEPPKHSLIKLKIKGPHARPENYTSSVITTYQTHNNTTIEQTIQGTPNNSIRRMRKKELLRQYWTQENMDDSNCAPQQDQAQNSTAQATNSGRSGIPKAVDSMSSIPTKDDYKDYTALDIKKRKVPPNRELRQLDVPSYDETMPERRGSVCSNASNTSSSNAGETTKRKTRTKQAVMTTPKLKIKLGPDVFEPSGIGESSSGSARPPKKRLSNIGIPSYEELRRDSMNFRKQVEKTFDDDSEVKPKKNKDKDKEKVKREKGSKHKKKKEKEKDKEKKSEVQIVSNDTNPSKLIIRFAKRKAETSINDSDDDTAASSGQASCSSSQVETSSTSSLTVPAAPIRLKLARSSQGGGYVATETTASTSNAMPKPKDNNADLARCQVVLTKLSACNLPIQQQQPQQQQQQQQAQQPGIDQSLNGKCGNISNQHVQLIT